MKTFFTIALFLSIGLAVHSQTIDLLIKNGHVIDPKNNIDAIMDVAITDHKISEVAAKITRAAKKTIDATGLYVVPGLIDMHGHHYFGTEPDKYLSDSYAALPPDGFTFRAGVTTVVDAGGAGWRNFSDFKNQAFANSKTRMFAFLNIVGAGMSGGAYEQNVSDMDAKLTAMVAKQYPDLIVGIKLAHYMSSEWTPTDRAVEAGKLAGIPVMVDFGAADPVLMGNVVARKTSSGRYHYPLLWADQRPDARGGKRKSAVVCNGCPKAGDHFRCGPWWRQLYV